MANIKIFSASAGSGKTYTLARQVIDLLISDPRSYAHILAVTFTNKATAEMKERIVGDLDLMANGPDSDHAREELLDAHLRLCHDRGDDSATREKVVTRAKAALQNILLDYGQFSVSTIDRFVQRVIRSFAYEQGLPSNYGLQLDTKPVVDGAVDDLMECLANDAPLRELVLKMTEEAIDNDKAWNRAETLIGELGETLLSEKVAIDAGKLSVENIKALSEAMESRLEDAAKAVYDIAVKVKELYAACGIAKTNGSMKPFISFVESKLPAFDFESFEGRRRALDLAIFIETTFDKKGSLVRSKTTGAVDEFMAGLDNLEAECRAHMPAIRTAQSVLKNIHILGVMGKLAELLDVVAERNNKVNMGGSGKLLADLIDECPVPFVYEKIGTRYDTIMIDEFQDTSHTQYGNFRPLLSESLAEGHDSLVVGDVKQSIYRFRGGDWQLLGREVEKDFSPDVLHTRLEDNYRSKSQIVNFNNALFRVMPAVMDSALYSSGLQSADGSANMLSMMYEHAGQNARKGDDGMVRLTLISVPKESGSKNAAQGYVEQSYVRDLKDALDCGYAFSDVCILVRKSGEAQAVQERLAQETWHGEPIPVMSDDTLLVMSSDATMCIADVMRYLSTGERGPLFSAVKTLSGLTAEALGAELLASKAIGAKIDELRGLGIIELTDSVVNMLPEALRNEDALYIDAFRQQIMEAVKDGEADLSAFIRRVDENATQWTVWATSSRPAVKLMTIHKSKGLEFKVVIIPYADWTLDPSKGKENIWCKADCLGIDSWRGASLPLTYNEDLSKGDFRQDYVAEREQIFADNLNMAYVAFTRPKEVLVAYGICPPPPQREKKDGVEPPGTISKYISASLSMMDGSPVTCRTITVDDEGFESADATCTLDVTEYSDGHLWQREASPGGNSAVAQLDLAMPETYDAVAHFKINAEAESRILADASDDENPSDGTSRALMISMGLTNHGILENVRTLADLHTAVRRAVLHGTLAADEAATREEEMRTRITSDPTVAAWFDSANVAKVWTETSMVGPAPAESPMPFVRRRPDRVMRMRDGRTVLVDYKFGKRSKRHHGQVKEYVKWLECCGFERVEAYLWYYAEGCVERVAL